MVATPCIPQDMSALKTTHLMKNDTKVIKTLISSIYLSKSICNCFDHDNGVIIVFSKVPRYSI